MSVIRKGILPFVSCTRWKKISSVFYIAAIDLLVDEGVTSKYDFLIWNESIKKLVDLNKYEDKGLV